MKTHKQVQDLHKTFCSLYLGGGLTSTAPLTIHVLDINDNAPTFQTNNYRVLIKENDIQYNSTPVAVMQVHVIVEQYYKNDSCLDYGNT